MDAGETLRERGAQRAGVQEREAPVAFDVGDGAGDDVAWREIAARVEAAHDGCAAPVHEHRPLAAHRFAHQRQRIGGDPHRGRMELHELEVGQHRAGARRHGDAATARPERGRRARVQAAEAAGREHHGAGGDHDGVAARSNQHGAADAAVGSGQQSRCAHAFEQRHARARLDRVEQRADDRGACRVGDVRDPPPRMRALEAQR